MKEEVNMFFDRHGKLLGRIMMGLCAVMAIFLFDIKLSLSGDDSDYIISAEEFIRHGRYPGGHGPLYPMILSLIVGVFGIKIVLLKFMSAVFLVTSFFLTYKGLRGLLPGVVLMPALLITSICPYVFFYGAYTYSEPLFMLFQGLFLCFFGSYFLAGNRVSSYPLKEGWKKYLAIAALALCMALTRSIGYAVLGAVIVFLLVRRRWRDALYMSIAFVAVFALYQAFKSAVWPGSGEAYGVSRIFSKDPYNPNLGLEDFPGMIKRFAENSDIYLSFFLYQFMGFIKYTPSEYVYVARWLTVFTFLLYGVCMVAAVKRNRALAFLGLYVGIMNFASFFALQSFWAQDRLLVVYYPLMLVFLLGGVYYLFDWNTIRKGIVLYPLIVAAIAYGTAVTSFVRVKENLGILQQNILGDRLYGLSPDWKNFINSSIWAAENLPADAVIVSRKPTISKVYTGRDFVVTPTALTVTIDDLLAFRDNLPEGATIVIMDAMKGFFQGDVIRYLCIRIKGDEFAMQGRTSPALCVYLFPTDDVDEFLTSAVEHNMAYTLDLDWLVGELRRMESFRVYDPQIMRQYLVDNNISYILLPQLRTTPSQYTGDFINDVHRYRDYISLRYPGSFRPVHTIGTAEACEIIEFIR
ncbi:MAG: glycosyltransferase family 39 protein [Tannerellaceae bacterium]|jgi:hypothetical protein|nr:glycosyltransferase family 39 protein [Tannerellaceae bacterium]